MLQPCCVSCHDAHAQFAGGPLPPEQLHQDLAALGERIYRQAAGQDPPPGAIELTSSSTPAAAAGPGPGSVLVLLGDEGPQPHVAGAASTSASFAAAAAAAGPAGADASRTALVDGASTGGGEGNRGLPSGTEPPGAERSTATPVLARRHGPVAGSAEETSGGLQAVRVVPVLLCMDPPVLTAVPGGTVGDYWAEKQQEQQRLAERAVRGSMRPYFDGGAERRDGGGAAGDEPQRVGRSSAAVAGMTGDVGHRMTQFLQSEGYRPTVSGAQRKEPSAPVARSAAAQRSAVSGGSGGGGSSSSDVRCWVLGPAPPPPPSQSKQPPSPANMPGVPNRGADEQAAPLQLLPLSGPSASAAAPLTGSHHAAEVPEMGASEGPTWPATGSRRGIVIGSAATTLEDGGGGAEVSREVLQHATAGVYHAVETATAPEAASVAPEAASSAPATPLRPPAAHSSALHIVSSTSQERTRGGSGGSGGGGGGSRRSVRASSSCGVLGSLQLPGRQRPIPGGGEGHSSNAGVQAPSPVPPSALTSYAGSRPPAGVMSAGWEGPAPGAAGSHVGFRRMASGTGGGGMLGRESSSASAGSRVPWGGTRRMSGPGLSSSGGGGRAGAAGAGELYRRSAEGALPGYGVGEWSSSGRFRPRCDSASSVQSDSGEGEATAETAEEEGPQSEAVEQVREGGQEQEQQQVVEGTRPAGIQAVQQEQQQQQESTSAVASAVDGDARAGAGTAPTPFDEACAAATECEAAATQAPGAGVPPSPGPWSSRLLPAAPPGPTQPPVPLGPAWGGQPDRDPEAAASAVGGAEGGWLQCDLSQGASAGSAAPAAARRALPAAARSGSGICLSPGDSASSMDAHRAAGVCRSAEGLRLGPGTVTPAARPTMGAVPADWVAQQQQQQQEKLRLAGPPAMTVIQEGVCDDDMWTAGGGQLGAREGAWMDRSSGVRPAELANLQRQRHGELRGVGGSAVEDQTVLVQQNPPSATDASCSSSNRGIPQQRPASSFSSASPTYSSGRRTPAWPAERAPRELLGDAAGQAASVQLHGATVTVHVFLGGGVGIEKCSDAASRGSRGEAEGAGLRTDDGSSAGWDREPQVEATVPGGGAAAVEAAVRLVVLQHGLVVAEERMRVGPEGTSVR